MKLLVVSQWFPYPPVNGAKKRVYHIIRGLGERHDIHLLSFTHGADDVRQINEIGKFCREVMLAPGVEYRPKLSNGLRAIFSARPRSSIATWSSTMAELIREQVKQYEFDAAISFTTMTAEYLVDLPLPTILDDDNVDSAYFRRLVKLADDPLTKFRRKLTWVKLARHERRLVARFDATVAVSEEDRQELARLVTEAEREGVLHVVPNGVDLGLMDYQASEVDFKTVVSTGALSYYANLAAAVFFCGEILPRLRAEIPDTRFLVTGGHDGVDIGSLTAAGATLTGFVNDIRPIVAGSAALVVPLRIGGGTRLKILEAMALGTPVVCTSLGGAGLGLKHEETTLIADDPAEFAQCTLRLMKDPVLRDRLAANGRRHVAANFGWERSVEAMEKVVLSVVRRGEKDD